MRTPTPDDPTPTCLCCDNARDVCTCTTRCDRIYHGQPPGKRGKPCHLRLAHYQVGERIRVGCKDIRSHQA